jgi:hypothetical protein
MNQNIFTALTIAFVGILLNPRLSHAQIVPQETCQGDYPLCPRLELHRLEPSRQALTVSCPAGFINLAPGSVLSSESVCREGLTLPSLWWTQEQFGSQGKGYPEYTKLVKNWLTYLPTGDRFGRVDLILELQRWSTMDYFKRYEFLTVFGTASHSFNYNLRAFSFRGEFLGAYTCQPRDPSLSMPPICRIELEGGGAQAKPTSFSPLTN